MRALDVHLRPLGPHAAIHGWHRAAWVGLPLLIGSCQTQSHSMAGVTLSQPGVIPEEILPRVVQLASLMPDDQ
jgi:hypothetical protein